MLKVKLKTIGIRSVVLLLILVLTGCGTVASDGGANKGNTSQSASSGEPINLKLAYSLPENHHIGQGMTRFADEVKNKTNGRVCQYHFYNSNG